MKNTENHSLIFERAHAFLKEIEDLTLSQELNHLLTISENNPQIFEELENRFGSCLQFGTAGMRGKMEAGTNRMNRPMVRRMAFATGTYFSSFPRAPIIIGFDGRHNSQSFAQDFAGELTALGYEVFLFPEMIPTPLCSFSVRYFKALLGVMITASHNPKYDNGIKIFGQEGAQLIAPHTKHIEALLEQSKYAPPLPPPSPLSLEDFNVVLNAYFSQVYSHSLHRYRSGTLSLRIAYTPLHGVGGPFTTRALKEAGFHDVNIVKSQEVPDGNFPTASSPNPEEKGALNEAIQLAESIQAELILANDPDADRLAVMVFSPEKNAYQALSGNEIGVLLGADILANSDVIDRKKLVISTIVSSRLLSQLASHYNASYADTLTGFANIMTMAQKREQDNHECFVFGYEEALGYCTNRFVYDKDGVSTAVRMAELIAFLKTQNRTVFDELKRLYLLGGLYVTSQYVQVFQGPTAQAEIAEAMTFIRKKPSAFFQSAPLTLHQIEDLANSTDASLKANVLIVHLKDGTRILVRPSGTEPKVKFYLEANTKVGSLPELESKQKELSDQLLSISNALKTAFQKIRS